MQVIITPPLQLWKVSVITVIRVAVGGHQVLLKEHGNSLAKQALSLTGVKVCKYINTRSEPTGLTPARVQHLLISAAAVISKYHV